METKNKICWLENAQIHKCDSFVDRNTYEKLCKFKLIALLSWRTNWIATHEESFILLCSEAAKNALFSLS